jgi:hypothetical protein
MAIVEKYRAKSEGAEDIKRGLNYIQKNHRGQWNKKQFNDEVMKELGVRGITVNGEDLVVKDVDKEFAETINGFYSDLEQTILDVSPTDKGTPKAWLKKIGTGDEAKWTGVTDWLNSIPKDQKLSRKEILDWLKENRIQVVEVVKGWYETPNINVVQTKSGNWSLKYDNGTFVVDSNGDNFKFGTKEDAELYLQNNPPQKSGATNTKFSQYQLEGQKENYKEVLVTLPKELKVEKADEASRRLFNKPYEKLGSNERGIVNMAISEQTKEQRGKDFKSSHFDEPNILVHLRMNTRTDAEGNKVLFLEEVQSDFGQQGKKRRLYKKRI